MQSDLTRTGENVLTVTYWYAHGASIIQNHKHQTNKQYQASESTVYFWVYGNRCWHQTLWHRNTGHPVQPLHRFILPQNGAQIGAPGFQIMATWHAGLNSAIAKQGTNFGVQSPAATSTNTLLFDLPHTKAFSWKRGTGIHSERWDLAISSENAVFLC